jgi:hypothetical protein
MSDRPTQHKQPKLDRALAAHERRARRIAQLHEQAIAAASIDPAAPQKTIEAGVTRHARWRKADRTIATAILRIIGAAMLIAGLGCIIAIWL